MESSTLKEALSEIERLSQDPKTVRLAIAREIHLKDQLQRERDAKLSGKEEGMELRGREIVLNMHKKSMSAEAIVELTNIPLVKVKEIIESVR